MEAFSKVLNDVHNKMYTGDILHREPSHVLLPEEEYPVPVVEFEEMFELMMVSKEEIQQDKKVYDMLQDVISCMRDTGMIDSYLRLVFTKGLGVGMIANKLISNTIRSNTIRRDDYETRIGKLLFIKKRIDIITSLIYKRDPFIKLCLKVAKYIQTIKPYRYQRGNYLDLQSSQSRQTIKPYRCQRGRGMDLQVCFPHVESTYPRL